MQNNFVKVLEDRIPVQVRTVKIKIKKQTIWSQFIGYGHHLFTVEFYRVNILQILFMCLMSMIVLLELQISAPRMSRLEGFLWGLGCPGKGYGGSCHSKALQKQRTVVGVPGEQIPSNKV